jgi:transcriptional regulator with XRE-family HTH domain
MSRQFSGHLLRAARTRQRLSRERLAVRAGISVCAEIRYEQGRAVPGVNAAVALADALGVELTSLLAAGTESAAGSAR